MGIKRHSGRSTVTLAMQVVLHVRTLLGRRQRMKIDIVRAVAARFDMPDQTAWRYVDQAFDALCHPYETDRSEVAARAWHSGARRRACRTMVARRGNLT